MVIFSLGIGKLNCPLKEKKMDLVFSTFLGNIAIWVISSKVKEMEKE
jgi:hypothetical protein